MNIQWWVWLLWTVIILAIIGFVWKIIARAVGFMHDTRLKEIRLDGQKIKFNVDSKSIDQLIDESNSSHGTIRDPVQLEFPTGDPPKKG